MSLSTDTAARLPVYVQIAELLLRDLAAGRLVDGERLPPERSMAEQLGVSIGTLRKSLNVLATQGVLERVQGSGNYIRAGGAVSGIYSMFRLELPEGGGLPRADVLSVEHMTKPSDLPAFGTAKDASRVRRIRFLNDTIVALEEIWLDVASGRIEKGAISESLYRYYQQHLGFWITRAEDRVRVAPVPGWAPDVLSERLGQTAGYVERLSWADKPDPVEFSRTWFDPERAHYVQRLK
jgi:GntR family transcriptional regulator